MYQENLAYIHDQGFGDYARQSADGILTILHSQGINAGSIVELGCGSGILTQALIEANYSVLGIDISPSMIAIAQQKVPQAQFEINSFFKADIPPCNAVISVGECLNYLFDREHEDNALATLFERIYRALATGGILLFDVVETSKFTGENNQKNFTEGKNWVVLVEKIEDRHHRLLTRRIISFRQVGENYQRDEEVHCIRVYDADQILQQLQQVGFEATTMTHYGNFRLPQGNKIFMGCKR